MIKYKKRKRKRKKRRYIIFSDFEHKHYIVKDQISAITIQEKKTSFEYFVVFDLKNGSRYNTTDLGSREDADKWVIENM